MRTTFARRFCQLSFDEGAFHVSDATPRPRTNIQVSTATKKSLYEAEQGTLSVITEETNSSLRKKSGGLKLGGKRAARLLFAKPIDANEVPNDEPPDTPPSSRFSLKDFDPHAQASLYERDIVQDAQLSLSSESEQWAARRKRIEIKQADAQARARWADIGVKKQTDDISREQPVPDSNNGEPQALLDIHGTMKPSLESANLSMGGSLSSTAPPPPPPRRRATPASPHDPAYPTEAVASVGEGTQSSSAAAERARQVTATLRGQEELSPQAALKRADALRKVSASTSAAMLLSQVHPGLLPVSAAAIVHRLGRHCKAQERQLLFKDERFSSLLEQVHGLLKELNSQSLCGVLWGLARLRHQPEWMLDVLKEMTNHAPEMTAHQISTALYCMSNNPIADTPEGQDLVDKLIATLRSNVEDLESGMDLVCTMTALSRLKVREKNIMLSCVKKCITFLEEGKLSVPEACQATSALASARMTDQRFLQAVKDFFARGKELKVKDVGHLCNALLKMEGEVDIFETFLPALKNTEEIGPKDMASILTALSVAKIADEEILTKVYGSLLSFAPQLQPHDVGKIVVSLARLAPKKGLANKSESELAKLLPSITTALEQATLRGAGQMSPHQISQCIYGFARLQATSDELWNELAIQLETHARFLYPENAVIILEAGPDLRLSREQMRPVFDLLLHKTGNFIGEESLRVLKATTHLAPELQLNDALITQFATNLRERVRVLSSRIDVTFLVNLLDYIPALRLQAPRVDLRPLLDSLLPPLTGVIKQMSRDGPASATQLEKLLRVVVHEQDFCLRVRRQITNTRPALALTLDTALGQLEAHLGNSVPLPVARVAAYGAQCGLDCENMRIIAQRALDYGEDWDSEEGGAAAALLLFCATEIGMPVDLGLVEMVANKKKPGAALLAWVAIAHERPDLLSRIDPQGIDEELAGVRNDLLIAQIALAARMANHARWNEWAAQHPRLGACTARLYVPQQNTLTSVGPQATATKLREDGSEKRLSQALQSVRIPHQPDALVGHGTYKVAAVIPHKNVCFDMWSYKTDALCGTGSIAVPSPQQRGGSANQERTADGTPLARSALLRRWQLEKCHGYEVVNFTPEQIRKEAADPQALLNSLLIQYGGIEWIRA